MERQIHEGQFNHGSSPHKLGCYNCWDLAPGDHKLFIQNYISIELYGKYTILYIYNINILYIIYYILYIYILYSIYIYIIYILYYIYYIIYIYMRVAHTSHLAIRAHHMNVIIR
jgi:hypothetical protein